MFQSYQKKKYSVWQSRPHKSSESMKNEKTVEWRCVLEACSDCKTRPPGSQPRVFYNFLDAPESLCLPRSSQLFSPFNFTNHLLAIFLVLSSSHFLLIMADHSQKEQSGQMDTAPGSTTDSLGMASASSPASTFTAASFVGQQPTRITVILGNGESFIIPFDTKRLVHDLHGEAVRRANALGFHCTVDNSVLRLKDHDGPMVYTGDSVCEILTFGDPTLFFGPLNRTDADEVSFRPYRSGLRFMDTKSCHVSQGNSFNPSRTTATHPILLRSPIKETEIFRVCR